MSTLNITIISGVQGDTRRYRAFHLREQMMLAGIPCFTDHITSSTIEKSVEKADLIILQRVTWDRFVSRMVDNAHTQGKLIIADLDDLVFEKNSFQWIDSPDFSDPIRAVLYKENLIRNQTTIDHCDGVMVSTKYLADQICKTGKPVWIHKNGFSLEMLSISQKYIPNNISLSDRIIIGYASGTPTHDLDFNQISKVLYDLLKAYPNLHIYLIGYVKSFIDWADCIDRVHYLQFVPYRKLPKLLAQFSINIAPLRLNNPFSRCKSELKYIEAALVGVPTVASAIDSFNDAIEHNVTGLLAYSKNDWEYALRYLIENPEKRYALGINAYNNVLLHYAPWIRARDVVVLINDILHRFRPERTTLNLPQIYPISNPESYSNLWIKEEIEKHPNYFERGIYTLRARGILTLIKEIWIFFRRYFVDFWRLKRNSKP